MRVLTSFIYHFVQNNSTNNDNNSNNHNNDNVNVNDKSFLFRPVVLIKRKIMDWSSLMVHEENRSPFLIGLIYRFRQA